VADNAIIQLGGDSIPEDALVIRYDAREAISRPFEVNVEFSMPIALGGFDVDTCLRTSAALAIVDDTGKQRVFHGMIDRAEYHGFTGTEHHFMVRLVPAISALAHRENCKIWQDTNVMDVAKDIFDESGCSDYDLQLFHGHESREYIVQYRESELNFIHRLFEDEGILYFFRHTPDKHTLVIADDVDAFIPAEDAPEVEFSMTQGFAGVPLKDFRRRSALRTTHVQLRDYDFEKPAIKPEGAQSADGSVAMPLYDYPGGFTTGKVGTLKATSTLRAQVGDTDVAAGSSRAIGLRCGVPFTVSGAAQSWLDGEYVVTELSTWGSQTRDGDKNDVCQNRFKAVPKDQQYMPHRRARRPRIRGVQTAIVTGASTENQGIHVDKYGRIKVRFYWDRIGQLDDKSSCWLRVSQYATGGNMLLPRIGWEMAIGFLNGDPDRPFSMGRIYNGEKVAPAGLPGAKATGGLKSYSTPGGAGINELHLGDEGGSMGWTLNAHKDLNVLIENDKVEEIDVDSSHDIKTNATFSVGSNETLSVGVDQTETTGSVRGMTVGGNQSITVAGSETNNATHNMLETVAGDRKYSVDANMMRISNTVMQTVTGNVSRTVGALQMICSIKAITDKIGGDYNETVGAIKAEAVYGTSSETVGGNKDATSIAAELHVLGGNYDLEGEGTVTYLVGGVHYQKIDGDLSVKGSLVTLLGATGDFKGGSGNLKLGGGPVVAKGSKIVAKAKGINVKLGASLKMG
jgi:type VI secretion system secreted protein VgrG